MNLSIVSCRFQIHLCIPACVMSSEFTCDVVMKFQPLIFLEFDVNVFTAILFISSKKITARYECRNADLNVAMTNGFIFQIIDLLMESLGVYLTWLVCKLDLLILVVIPIPCICCSVQYVHLYLKIVVDMATVLWIKTHQPWGRF